MAKHLYLIKSESLAKNNGGDPFFFGVKASALCESYDDFFSLDQKISLKNDLKWGEVSHFQKIFRGADIWTNFPAEGLKFVFAELKAGDEEQRVDILYLRDDGGLYPCELKIGGTSLDAHGQLIRYISDLFYQKINASWLIESRLQYLKNNGTDSSTCDIEKSSFLDFLATNRIEDRHIHLLKNSGIIVDEGFKSQVLKAVRYLNEQCGFSIRLLRVDAFVAKDWTLNQSEFKVRIDIVEMQ